MLNRGILFFLRFTGDDQSGFIELHDKIALDYACESFQLFDVQNKSRELPGVRSRLAGYQLQGVQFLLEVPTSHSRVYCSITIELTESQCKPDY